MKKIFGVALVCLVFISGCISTVQIPEPTEKDIAISRCIELCNWEKNRGRDLSNGPCLSENITNGWVCDVAHDPREEIDNLEENQCSEWQKTAFHFVEVTPECKFIRAF